MTNQSGGGPTPSGPGEPPEAVRIDKAELVVCVVAAVAFVYLLWQPAPPARPTWQTIGLYVMLAVALSRIIAILSRRSGK